MSPPVTFLTGAKDALRLLARPDVTASATSLVPPPELSSPWGDASHLHTVVWSDIYGSDVAELLPLTRAEAMAIPAVARARNVEATTLGRLPIEAVSGSWPIDGPADPLPSQPTVLVQPDPAQPRYVTLTWTVDDLIFFGESWWYVLQRGADGKPLRFRRLHPGSVDPTPDRNGNVRIKWGNGTRTVPVADVVRIDGPHEGILNFASRSLRHARALELAAKKFAENPVPAVELHQTSGATLDKTARDELIQGWVDARKGLNGGVAYTSPTIEAKLHGAPAENLLTHGRNAAAIDQARNVGVPADAIDAVPEKASMTYANVESRNRTLIDYGLAAYAAAVEARLSMDDVLPHGTAARWTLASITAPSATQAPPEVTG